jgi:hypothetical protein
MPEFEAEQESRLWRWLLGVVVLALVIWAAAELSGSDRPVREQASVPPAADGPGTALGEPPGDASAAGDASRGAPAPGDASRGAPAPGDASRGASAPGEASGDASDRRVPTMLSPGVVPVVSGAGFQAWVRDSAELGERLDGQEYVAAGLERLTSALHWLAGRVGDSELEIRAAAIRSATGRLTPGSAAYAGEVRELFGDAARFVATANARIGADATVEHNVQAALAAASSLNTDAPLERQRHRVFSYFDHIGEAIAAAGVTAGAIRP